jgi:hypothetical protein
LTPRVDSSDSRSRVKAVALAHTTVSESKMSDVKSIEKAVEALPPAELAEFRRWFAEFDAVAWDDQIEHDAKSGKLDHFASEALADYKSGKAREL